MSIEDLISGAGQRLTPADRRIAEQILADPTLLAFGTVSDLAQRAGTSRPSVVRFATRLGFAGYAELQQRAREGVAQQLVTPSERLRRDTDDRGQVGPEVETSVRDTLGALDPDRLELLAGPLVEARSVVVLSGETSRAGAIVLHSGLSMVRERVRLIRAHDLGRELSSVGPGDAAVVFDFARYRRSSVTAARTLVDLGVELVAITDGPLSPIATLTDRWCALRVPAVGPFDSSLPAVLAAELMVLEVVRRLGTEAQDRIDRLERLWTLTKTFIDDD